ncbi:putative signal transducing protein [Mesohalobacter salilacus]|uniref:putative signal transducing protein n=1 Tax=Mesohalobacter salilacus TaxID=2491711 RepID=UPI0026C1A965
MKNYSIIARYSYTFEYVILKLLLDKAGIRYFLKNEQFASIMPMSAIGNNGILLMVHQADKVEAEQILKDFNASDLPLKLV